FLLFVSLIFPPSLYESYVGEPDYMFLNIKMLAFVLLCVFFYYIGVFISNYKPLFSFNLIKKKVKVSPFAYIGIISVLTIVLQLIFVFLMFIYFNKTLHLNLLEIVLSGKGQLIKDYLGKEVRIPFGLGGIPLFVTGIEFWLLYKLYTFQADLNDLKKFRELKYLEISIVVSLVLFIISNIITLNRPTLMIFLIGWFVIYSYFNKGSIFYRVVKLFITVVLIFAITSILRWASGSENLTDLVLGRLLGYTVADFNRLALIIEGKLSYVDAGVPRIFYILPILKIPLTNIEFFDLRETSSLALSAVGSAGLNSDYNMATLFGGIYQSIGVATPIYFTVLGFIGSRLYISFKRGKTFGIMLYPLFYASVALWMIDVNVFFMFFPYFFYAFVLMMFYDNFIEGSLVNR
ncbi:MAG: hypothetical protein OWQ49_03710, partial [Aquificaceae bacterium]|nr:hypothetical protein [Aquificaceae bacterium]